MAPMFVNGKDPAIAALAQEEGGNAGGRGLAQQPSLGDYRPGTSDGDGNRLPLDARQGLAAQKAAWLTNAGNAGQDVVTAPFRPPLSKYQIQAGVIIHAALLTAVNTDLPGDVVALITHDVFDTASGQYLLIPSGSKLYGRYDNQLSYGQTRAAIAWNRILFRNGTSQNIGAMVGTDSSGSAGVEADVDRHYGRDGGSHRRQRGFHGVGAGGGALWRWRHQYQHRRHRSRTRPAPKPRISADSSSPRNWRARTHSRSRRAIRLPSC